MKRKLVLLSLLLAVCMLMTACKAKMSTAKSDNVQNGTAQEQYSANAGTAGDNTADAGTADNTSASKLTENSSHDLDTRKLIKDVTMSIQTKSYDAFMTGLKSAIDSCGGYVQSSKSTGNSYMSASSCSATVVARIPADKLDAFMSRISSAGNVTSKTENVQDVTSDYVDIESRIAALKTEQESLLNLMKNATNMDDILTIEKRLTEVRTDLESYESKQRTYDNLVAYSTVTMDIAEVEKITPVSVKKQTMWQEIGGNLKNNLTDIGMAFRSIFIWFVSALPYLLLIAFFAFAALWIIRMATRKSRRERQRPYTPIIPPTDTSQPKE